MSASVPSATAAPACNAQSASAPQGGLQPGWREKGDSGFLDRIRQPDAESEADGDPVDGRAQSCGQNSDAARLQNLRQDRGRQTSGTQHQRDRIRKACSVTGTLRREMIIGQKYGPREREKPGM